MTGGFHDGRHYWGCGVVAEWKCWCKPFPHPFGGTFTDGRVLPIPLHRPQPGWVFWEHGEQGPIAEDIIEFHGATMLENPVFDDLDKIS